VLLKEQETAASCASNLLSIFFNRQQRHLRHAAKLTYDSRGRVTQQLEAAGTSVEGGVALAYWV